MFKKVHKGDADILSKGKIAEALTHAGKYWDTLVKHKNKLISRHLSTSERNSILGELFFDSSILSGMQLNIIKKEIEKPSFDYGRPDTAWALYNHITLALKETHPADWIDHQIALHDVFKSYIPIEVEPALLPSGIADLYTKLTGSDYGTAREWSSTSTSDTVAVYPVTPQELPF
jgi:hypothetical protein